MIKYKNFSGTTSSQILCWIFHQTRLVSNRSDIGPIRDIHGNVNITNRRNVEWICISQKRSTYESIMQRIQLWRFFNGPQKKWKLRLVLLLQRVLCIVGRFPISDRSSRVSSSSEAFRARVLELDPWK